MMAGPELLFNPIFSLLPAAIGGGLGVAVGLGIRRGRSRLPGVERLASVVNPDGVHSLRVGLPSTPRELIPACSPEGRGDELASDGR